ncbi:DNA polymerase III subunit epsilon [Candidatus Vallotia cooleyia]|uniref:DNA polymerase III subunit epsilon n=1 Tax=Candidatus Vallotiella adelgis TaxID=1177211 RepID=UPI001D00A93A|nr:DNA polymerase III subunit epsilon [Candidatus Vallotia cooleyia]UDG82021.1 DNA polymerase III subunit epsilon [Candidatus Vallotia cooleyia]
MRLLVLDTETTGLNAKGGDRIIEIGCVEIINRQLTGNNLHLYINPERDSDPGALAVHGLTTEFLRDKPKFSKISALLRDFIKDSSIIIHNAPFDISFLDAEFSMLGLPPFRDHCGEVIDTLLQARAMFPGKRNSLNALCDRFGISNTHRTLHGALLDAKLLADIYLKMTRGQECLAIDILADTPGLASVATERVSLAQFQLPILSANDDELAAHADMLDQLDKTLKKLCVWRETLCLANKPLPIATV